MTSLLQPLRPPHGHRLLFNQIDEIARENPNKPWVSVPLDELDLSGGFQDITYQDFVRGADVAGTWLRNHLELPEVGFPSFLYAGPRDLRYPLLALAAGKLGYQMIIPASTVTAVGQQRLMEQKKCLTYLHAGKLAAILDDMIEHNPRLRTVAAPDLSYFMSNVETKPIEYTKSWPDGASDPWLVFHTSGTTGTPKIVTYTQRMMSVVDVVAGLNGAEHSHLAQYRNSRCYMPVPIMHFVAMHAVLGLAAWGDMVPVFGPVSRLPSPAVIKEILNYTHVDGLTLSPALIDALCRDGDSLALIRKLKYVKYAGAPISVNSGKLLSAYVHIAPSIGSTEAGAYPILLPNTSEDWDYVSFHPHGGTVMEHRADNMYELVYIRHPRCEMQPIFDVYPDFERFGTNDLWIEHPSKAGQWKIHARGDDLIKLSNGEGIFASPIESKIAEHPLSQNVLVGGHGMDKPVVLIELVDSAAGQLANLVGKASLVESLEPYITMANERCHQSIRFDSRLIVFAVPEKPWPRTMKDTIIRSQTLQLYDDEIRTAYRKAGVNL